MKVHVGVNTASLCFVLSHIKTACFNIIFGYMCKRRLFLADVLACIFYCWQLLLKILYYLQLNKTHLKQLSGQMNDNISDDFRLKEYLQKIILFQIYLHIGLQFQTFGFSFTNIQTFYNGTDAGSGLDFLNTGKKPILCTSPCFLLLII